MSSTRRAAPGGPLRQNRYASSPQFQTGLSAIGVAKKADLMSRADRQLIWFLQRLSNEKGEMAKICEHLAETRGAELEIGHSALTSFYQDSRWMSYAAMARLSGGKMTRSEFLEEALPFLLNDLCVNPALNSEVFPKLFAALHEYKSGWIEARRAATVVTALGAKVYNALKYSLASGSMVLIDGLARTGKSFSAKAWCDLHPGQARYCQVPSSSDDLGFYKAIAKSVGVANGDSFKAQQIRLKIEEALQTSRLMLVLDEAHYLWLSGSRKEILPRRVNWLLTALVNYAVPVALVTTPQFLRTQKNVEKNSGWTSEQLIGRIYRYVSLPPALSQDDLTAVAKSLAPEVDANSIRALVIYADKSAKYLAGIDAVIKHARFIASEDGRERITGHDVRAAMSEGVMPSDKALAEALSPAGRSVAKSRDSNPPLVLEMPAARQSSLASDIPTRESQPVGIE